MSPSAARLSAARSHPVGALARVIALIWLILLPDAAMAHGRSVSYSSWEIDGSGAHVTLRLKLLELSRLGPQALPPGSVAAAGPAGRPDLPARAFPHELILEADDVPCTPEPVAARRPDEPGWVQYQWRVDCGDGVAAAARTLAIRSQLLLAVAPSHMHFARVRRLDTSTDVREQVLTEASPRFLLRSLGGESDASSHTGGSRLVDYLWIGIEHIITGWDHLAFVLGLLLLARRLGEVARLITGFTLAHSLTLAMAVLEIVHPRTAAVEAVIAFSVALVAIEKAWNVAGRPAAIRNAVLIGLAGLGLLSALGRISLPGLTVVGLLLFTACYFKLLLRSESAWVKVALTFAFGLVHGFGFAGILVEMTLPTERLVPALLGFNLGVEIGQIGVVLLAWPLLALAERRLPATIHRLGIEVATAGLCGLGLYWLAERTFGG
jgi:hypothetical protein